MKKCRKISDIMIKSVDEEKEKERDSEEEMKKKE